MIEHTFRVLEYYRLLDILSHYASCQVGQSDCLSLRPSDDLKLIDNELRLVSEMRLLLKVKGFLSFSGLTDILPLLKKSSVEGSCLEAGELLSVLRLMETSLRSKEFVKSNRSLCAGLYDLVKDIPPLEGLVKMLNHTVAPNGTVKDSASHDLKRIRGKKIRLRADVERNLVRLRESKGISGETKDHPVTVRDGRYVIAVRTGQKSRVEGIIHDYSQTRATCFLEPVEVIQDNNRMAELAQEEREEEFRILRHVTGMVREQRVELENFQSLIGRLDGIRARGKFSEALSCVMPEINMRGGIQVKGAKNPILLALALEGKGLQGDSHVPVSVDILKDESRNVLIISGPNRGGKTVTLKTLGLMSLMTQAGIHIPAEEGSRLPVFDQIMADIGDDQDIQAGLSTFSAHAGHLKYITEHADQNSLVIIDEPGMGTDPDEGVALAMAVLDLLSQKRASVAVSTHMNRLKTYGLLNERVVNASVEFDTEKRRPTFRLNYGSPGISHALEIARGTGMSLKVLEKAKGYLDQDEVRLNRLIEKLNSLMAEADRKKSKAEAAKREYHDVAREIEERIATLNAEKNALIEAKREEASTAINMAREEFKQAINLFKKGKGVPRSHVTERYAEITGRLTDYFESKVGVGLSARPGDIKKGCIVFHGKLKQKGVVEQVDISAGRAELRLGKVRMTADIKDLEVVREVRESIYEETAGEGSWYLTHSPSKEVNVIGYKVDDAIPLIDRTLDRALIEGGLTLRIVHGFGTGRLREAIRTHLRGVPHVKKICSADSRSGGDAITIVKLS